MQLEDYFDFQRPDDIRIKGTRVGIETILYDYIELVKPPEEIAQTYPTITLEQVYATILYYLNNKEAVTNYMIDWMAQGFKMRAQQRLNPPPIAARLRKMRAEKEATSNKNDAEISVG